MKYNKREVQAIEALDKLLKALRNDKCVSISESDAAAINETFGYGLSKNTYTKSEVEKCVRGKDKPLLKIKYYGIRGPYFKYCFFPFQVKVLKE